MAHTAHKVAVRGGDTDLTLAHTAHMTAQAGAAGRCGDGAASLQHILIDTLFNHLLDNILRSGQNDAADTVMYLTTLQDLRRGPHITDTAIGAGADDHLIDHNPLHVPDQFRVAGQIRHGDSGIQRTEVNVHDS